MRRILRNRWLKRSAGALAALIALTLACAAYLRVWGEGDLRAYLGMCWGCHPVWRDLHWGRIRAGQDVEQVIAATRPVRVERFGHYVRLSYEPPGFAGLAITAKDGHLVGAAAWSCTWDREFFNALTPDEWKAYADAYEARRRPAGDP